MKLCIDCRFFSGPLGLGDYCIRESVLENESRKNERPSPSPVDGRLPPPRGNAYRLNRLALDYRTSGECGIEAKFFEPKRG